MRRALLATSMVLASPAAAQVVHPATDVVPANLLRVSVSFDQPQPASVGRSLSLAGADGHPIEGAFYPQPLWSPDRRTLTVYLDPGRVKTGLAIRAALGPVLAPGGTVQALIDGRALRTWRVTVAHEVALRPALNGIQVPHAGTREGLALPFASPIDWQDRDLIGIEGPDHRRLEGQASLVDGERIWTFRPEEPWRPGVYVLRINPDLEDPEGNRIDSPFETRIRSFTSASTEFKHAFSIGGGINHSDKRVPQREGVNTATDAPTSDLGRATVLR